MTTKPESATQFKDLAARALDIEKRTKDVQSKFELATKGLKAQLKQEQATSASVILKVMQAEAGKMETLLSVYIPGARKLADTLTNDTEYAELHLKAIVGHTRTLDKCTASLTEMLKSAQAQEIEAETFLEKADSSDGANERILAALKHNVGAFSRRLTKIKSTLEDLSAGAKDAVKLRNDGALRAAKDKAQTVLEPTLVTDLAATDRDVIRFRKEILAKTTSADAKARWTSELADFDEARKEVGELLDSCKARTAEIDHLQLAPPDADKAAAALQVDAKHRLALGNALRGDDATVQRNLENLAKKIGHKLSGKEMFARLRKNKQI